LNLTQFTACIDASGLPPDKVFGTVESTAAFIASATGDSTMSLWRTDGTAAGTYVIASVAPSQALTPLFFGSRVKAQFSLQTVLPGSGNATLNRSESATDRPSQRL